MFVFRFGVEELLLLLLLLLLAGVEDVEEGGNECGGVDAEEEDVAVVGVLGF